MSKSLFWLGTTSLLGTCKLPLDPGLPRSYVKFSIQFAGALGVSNCPGAPRLPVFLGRPNGMPNPIYTPLR